jgi:HlyD family secretion protein
MKKTFVLILSIAAAALLAACGTAGTEKTQSTPTAGATQPSTNTSDAITATGKVVPLQDTVLSFATPGLVSEVLATEGQEVQAGQVMARLSDTQSLRTSLAGAELEIQSAQLSLDQMTAPVAIANVQKAVAQDKQDIDDAQQAFDNQKYFTTNQNAVQNAHSSLVLAKKALEDAQTDYDKVPGDPSINLGKANAYQKLYAAQLAYNNANYVYGLWTGSVNSEQLDLKAATLAIAKAKLAEDQTFLDVLNGGAMPADANGAGIIQLQQARLNLQVAQDKVDSIKAALANLELKAPFSGTVTSLNLKVGMFVQPGMEMAKLVDSSSWLVKTTDLSELNVVKIQPGMGATVTLDAIPGVQMTSQVQSIEKFGQTYQGDIVYAVTLKLDKPDPRLRWNMTATVTFGNTK